VLVQLRREQVSKYFHPCLLKIIRPKNISANEEQQQQQTTTKKQQRYSAVSAIFPQLYLNANVNLVEWSTFIHASLQHSLCMNALSA